MNMDLAKRLVELRVYNDMSQDDLAAKANIEKKDIEKWETGKDSPDGEQLIKLSQVYNMPIDEILLNFDTDAEHTQKSDSDPVIINNIDYAATQKKKSFNWYAFPYPILVVGLYLCIGFMFDIWHPTWLLILTIPVYYMMVTFTQAKTFSGKAYVFPYPIIIVILYLALGFDYDIWHPAWLLFFTIPIYYMAIAWLDTR